MNTQNSHSRSFSFASVSFAQAPDRQQFIRTEAPIIALTHVRVIDGTGANAKDDQTIVISEGKIQSVTATTTAKILRMHRRWI
jgi:hypothetical protein